MIDNTNETFVVLFNAVQKFVSRTAVEKGWWEGEQNKAEKIALMHSELSEALEYLRHGDLPSDHLSPKPWFRDAETEYFMDEHGVRLFTGVEEEFADVIIRIMDYAEYFRLRVAEAVIAKARYNKNREYKHGGKEF